MTAWAKINPIHTSIFTKLMAHKYPLECYTYLQISAMIEWYFFYKPYIFELFVSFLYEVMTSKVVNL